jgi:GxxExxY protein
MNTDVSRKHGKFLYGELSDKIIELAVKIHKKLGSGFIEKIYEKAMALELKRAGVAFREQEVIRVDYEGVLLGDQRVDFIIEDKVIVELKAVSELNEIHQAQMLSYLKAADKRVGLLLNFAKPILGIKRLIN